MTSALRMLRGMHQAVLDKAGPLLNAVVASYAAAMDPAKDDIVEAIAQMSLAGADDEFLDFHGEIYGVLRAAGELDDDYRARIRREVFRLRVNAYAIEKAILDETGWDVRIEEPWRDLFILDDSVLSGPNKTYDGVRYGYHLIRPFTRQSVDWQKVRAIIDRNRAAGVVVVEYRVVHGSLVDASEGMFVHFKNTHLDRSGALYEDRALLDYMAIEDVSIANQAARQIRNIMHSSGVLVDDSQYAVTGVHARTNRAYYISATYAQQYWLATSWAKAGASTWRLNAFISSAHKRS